MANVIKQAYLLLIPKKGNTHDSHVQVTGYFNIVDFHRPVFD